MKKQPKRLFAEDKIKKIMKGLDIPEEVIPNMTRMEITSNNEMYIENCKGILDYDDTMIRLSAGRFSINILGKNLLLKNLNQNSLVISGVILNIEFAS